MVEWHPVLDLEEVKPGQWILRDGLGKPHSIIQIVRRSGEVGYRVDTWPKPEVDAALIGFFTTLRASAEAANRTYIVSLNGFGAPKAHWG